MPKVTPQGSEGTIWFGGHPDEVGLCLRVFGDSLDPDLVFRSLGCKPSRSQRKGAAILSPTGESKRIARTSSWLLDYQVTGEATIGEAIELLLGPLPGDGEVWTSLTSQFSVDLICDVTIRCVNRGFELDEGVLGLLADRGIALSFDIFCWPDPRDVEAS